MNANIFIKVNAGKLGEIVKSRRKSAGITQQDLAELCGVALHTISDLESGKGNPTLVVMDRILEVLGLEIEIRPRTMALQQADS